MNVRVQKALDHLDLSALDVLFIENVDNLVCPASFDGRVWKKKTNGRFPREHLVLSAFTDIGEGVHSDTLGRLMAVTARVLGIAGEPPEEDLARIAAERKTSLLERAEQENGTWLDEENEKFDAYADDLERAFEIEVKALEAEIRDARKTLRGSSLPMAEKLAEKRRIGSLEAKRDKMKIEFFDRRAKIRSEVEEMLDRIQESLRIEPTLTPLFTVRWEVV